MRDMPAARARKKAEPHPLAGEWSCTEEGDSNLVVAIDASGARLRVRVSDAYDGEAMRVSRVGWDGKALRFTTTTPSTGAVLEHELRPTARGRAAYRCTVVQRWARVDPPGG